MWRTSCSKYIPRAPATHTFPGKQAKLGLAGVVDRDVYQLPEILWLISDFFEESADLQALEGISYEGFCQWAGRPSLPVLEAPHEAGCPVVWNILFLWDDGSGLSTAGTEAKWAVSDRGQAACLFSYTVSDNFKGGPIPVECYQFGWINSTSFDLHASQLEFPKTEFWFFFFILTGTSFQPLHQFSSSSIPFSGLLCVFGELKWEDKLV